MQVFFYEHSVKKIREEAQLAGLQSPHLFFLRRRGGIVGGGLAEPIAGLYLQKSGAETAKAYTALRGAAAGCPG